MVLPTSLHDPAAHGADRLDLIMTTHLLSQHAFDRLQAELEDLSTRGRIEVAEKIERAPSWRPVRER